MTRNHQGQGLALHPESDMNKDKVVDISKHRPATVYLQSYGQYKVPIIKVIKDQFDLGLAAAKSLVENAPCEVGSFTSRAAS